MILMPKKLIIISCFAHTIQLVVHKFSSDESLQTLMKRVHSLVKKVNHPKPHKSALSGKKLISDCPTKWSSTFLMADRLVQLKIPLTRVLEELEWDSLVNSEWKTLENIQKLLKPFAQYTSLVSGEDYTTVSCVIPILMELNYHPRRLSCVMLPLFCSWSTNVDSESILILEMVTTILSF